jgi:hypothetical protein
MLENCLGEQKEKDENTFNKDEFIKDRKDRMKFVDLIEKYNMSLYQVREAKKNFYCKSR